MMTGRLFIGPHDAFQMWTMYVVEGGWNEVIGYPSLKTVDYNEWAEEEGIEPDLSAPRLDRKDATLKVCFRDASKISDFMAYMKDAAYHEFDCRSIGRKYILRMVQITNVAITDGMATASLKMSLDFPMDGYTYQPPLSTWSGSNDYRIDERRLAEYGCRVTQGTLPELSTPAPVREGLMRNLKTLHGVIYEDDLILGKNRDIKINCLMRGATLEELWRNYDALLHDLIQPGERKLATPATSTPIRCFYKSATVSGFHPRGIPWISFSLTLTTIDG